MITMITHVHVPPENAEAYEALLSQVQADILANEPGVRFYSWAKSAVESDRYVVIEVYQDEHAHAEHMSKPWITESIPAIRELIHGNFEIAQYVSPGQTPVLLKHASGDC